MIFKSSEINIGTYGQAKVTKEQALSLGLTHEEALKLQKQGDFRFSLLPAAVGAGLMGKSMSDGSFSEFIGEDYR